uniref:Uncharacterized protein n=1 Tax=Anguilla anguilla TaxID=7936 RepID=A0A0E9T0Z2_ANGAN
MGFEDHCTIILCVELLCCSRTKVYQEYINFTWDLCLSQMAVLPASLLFHRRKNKSNQCNYRSDRIFQCLLL